MARRQICALLLVAAASADVNETAASESRVRALAGQSYDWLADRAPAAKAFAAQAAAQHGPGFIGGALAAVLCMLLGGKKQTKSGARTLTSCTPAKPHGPRGHGRTEQSSRSRTPAPSQQVAPMESSLSPSSPAEPTGKVPANSGCPSTHSAARWRAHAAPPRSKKHRAHHTGQHST